MSQLGVQHSFGSDNISTGGSADPDSKKDNKTWKWSNKSLTAAYKTVMNQRCKGLEDIITKKSVSSAIASSFIDSIYLMVSSKEEVETADMKNVLNLILFGKQQG